jgi:hypothetical protein
LALQIGRGGLRQRAVGFVKPVPELVGLGQGRTLFSQDGLHGRAERLLVRFDCSLAKAFAGEGANGNHAGLRCSGDRAGRCLERFIVRGEGRAYLAAQRLAAAAGCPRDVCAREAVLVVDTGFKRPDFLGILLESPAKG